MSHQQFSEEKPEAAPYFMCLNTSSVCSDYQAAAGTWIFSYTLYEFRIVLLLDYWTSLLLLFIGFDGCTCYHIIILLLLFFHY